MHQGHAPQDLTWKKIRCIHDRCFPKLHSSYAKLPVSKPVSIKQSDCLHIMVHPLQL